ncbi:MAG: dihydrolipoyl dehydrogenase family protein [Thermoproteota archaeon]
MKVYDLVVIGSGSGLNILNEGLRRGLQCALIESGKMGGTCLTRGCIPSKILVYPADLISRTQHGEKVGVHFQKEINWDLIRERVWSKIDKSQKIKDNLSQIKNLTLYRGRGEFVGECTLRVEMNNGQGYSEELRGKRMVIASGARSFVPPIQGLDRVGYVTSDTFFGEKFPEKPWDSLIIVGGGIIAVEFANIFSSFGTEIKIVEMKSRLVSTEEPEVSDFLKTNLERFMEVYLNKKAVSTRLEGKSKVVTVEDMDTGEKQDVRGEEVFVASGRRSNSDLLKPQNSGVEVDNRGWIKTNQFLETTAENIWCIGDANGGFQLRHRANYDAEICIHNMFNEENRRKKDYSVTPWAIYSHPQIGHVGMTQNEAIEAGYKISVATKHYSSVAKGYAMGYEKDDADDGFVKLIVSRNREILGAHIIGPHAAVLVQPFAYLMNTGYTCPIPGGESKRGLIQRLSHPCPESGTFMPIEETMVIHPSLNEVAAWAIGSLKPVKTPNEE